tara:strand:+ start:347 stop:496 length:150 start_codon:yes stop_codon:yes gene_type:complete
MVAKAYSPSEGKELHFAGGYKDDHTQGKIGVASWSQAAHQLLSTCRYQQ